jgi:hypothetical protein
MRYTRERIQTQSIYKQYIFMHMVFQGSQIIGTNKTIMRTDLPEIEDSERKEEDRL